MLAICITWWGKYSTYLVCQQTCVLVIAIIMGECTFLLPQKYVLMVCAVSFGFWSSCLKVYIHLWCINQTATKNKTIFFVILIFTGEFNMLILQKYGFKVCMTLIDFIQLIIKFISIYNEKTQRQTTSPFDITHFISSNDRQTPILYQVSDNSCEVDFNSNIFFLLQPSKTVHYCHQ